ncbi:MAG TPA: MBL fold metallo-hydrolase, partial [Planctomycetota bacterium]|nr:MBL fold metallo-hydrolase [Planctomycetota bacterium]
ESGGATDYLYAKQQLFRFEPAMVDRVLHDGDEASLGGLILTARHTPGHTRGCTTWTTTVDDGGRSFRVVFLGSTSVNPGTKLVRDASYPGIADDYRHSLDVLDSLQPDVFVAPHTGFFDFDGKRARAATEGVAAWVDPAGYRRRLAKEREKVEALIAGERAPSGAN